MNSNRVWIRADGSSKIGLGHLVRCVALANMLKTEFDIRFACKEVPESFMNDVQSQGFALMKIEKEEDFFAHVCGSDIVVLDHYSLDTNYQKQIKKLGCKIVCIDDLHDKMFFADLIINHAPGIKATDYEAQIYTQFALGPNYALLRPAFLEQAKKKRKVGKIETVLICFGGADYNNLTQCALEAVLEYPEFKSVIVITGAAYEHKERLKDVLNQNDVITYYHAIDENNMADLMAEADVAIVPASGILLEALASGCKVVSGMYSDNQKFLFDEYKSLKAFYSAEDFSQENIVYGLNNVMKKQLILNETILDGNSHARLLKLFKQLQTEDQVLLRKIEQKDLLRTYEWASDPEIRKFFFNPEVIGLTDHKKWFNRKLKDQNCFYYLGFINNKAFGSIRFDIQEHKTYVSYLIDPKYQNRGLGSIILKKALHLFVNSTAYNLTIYAEVFLQNHASARVFEKLGFAKELASPNDDILVFKKRIKN